jgi:hypothetical protein
VPGSAFCPAAMTGTHTVSESPLPTITRSGGNANQTVNQNTAITDIVYTATYATGISLSSGSFPIGISGIPSGLSYTISGASADTFGYTVTTANNNGCTNATASGTITVVPQYAASTQTWVYGSQTWSDAIRIPECNNLSFNISNTSPDCRSYTPEKNTWYYYNWVYVNNNANVLCPSPWHVPTLAECQMLVSNISVEVLRDTWGFGGGIASGNANCCPTTRFYFWSITSAGDKASGFFGCMNDSLLGTYIATFEDYKYYGMMVRCVK